MSPVQNADKVDALDRPLLGVVVMPANQLILIHVGLFRDAVVQDQNHVITFVPTDQRLDQAPDIRRVRSGQRQLTVNLVVAQVAVQ